MRLKAVGALPDISWKELIHLNGTDDPFNLQRLTETPSPYVVIKNPYSSPDDVATGQNIFQSNCVQCHGANGVGGGAGPKLQQRQMQKGGSDWALFKTISNGIAGTSMPSSILPETDRWKLVAYVKSLAEAPATPVQANTTSRIASIRHIHYEDILGAGNNSHEWLTYSGTYNGHRFSSNEQINTKNVATLRLEWMRQYSTEETSIETSPLIVDGFMFVTVPPNRVEALDAKTGAIIWSYDYALPQHMALCCGYVNRGLAVLGKTVYLGTLDAHLVALDIGTGRVLWDVEIADYKSGYSITSAPLVVKNMVITGVAGGEFAIRGFITARDAITGREIWRFDSVPRPGQLGADTWEGDSWKNGGGPTWLTGTFDPQLNTLYWPTGNPSPDHNGRVRTGDNLFTNSVLALDVDHGELRWYFQFTPHDYFDWDATEILIAIDKEVAGKRQQLLSQANRNAFYYVLNRTNGHFVTARPYTKQTWAKQIDSDGRPIVNPSVIPTPSGAAVYPSSATNWMSPSYSPVTGLVYVPSFDSGGILYLRTAQYPPSERSMGGYFQDFTNPPTEGVVRALDALTGQVRWEYRNKTSTVGGLLSTKGGVVFGSAGRFFLALDAKTGRELRRIDTGGAIRAAPVTYSIGGKQFVTIAAGHDILTFGL